ncbi:MAG: hypothetical protein PUG68_04895 [Lachnospiraceae bacterium]|nr:hypothetical protein [Lachnospiraceae bacterium]MDY2759856.1 hypothetical protein [Lachnospiraceae bacterium]
MAVSTDYSSSYLSVMNQQAQNLTDSKKTGDITSQAESLGKGSSTEDLKSAMKSFESYFVEQMIKEVKKTNDALKPDDDTDGWAGQMSDMYMDSTISTLASQIVDKYGDNFTDEMVDHMKLEYGITDDENN